MDESNSEQFGKLKAIGDQQPRSLFRVTKFGAYILLSRALRLYLKGLLEHRVLSEDLQFDEVEFSAIVYITLERHSSTQKPNSQKTA